MGPITKKRESAPHVFDEEVKIDFYKQFKNTGVELKNLVKAKTLVPGPSQSAHLFSLPRAAASAKTSSADWT